MLKTVDRFKLASIAALVGVGVLVMDRALFLNSQAV